MDSGFNQFQIFMVSIEARICHTCLYERVGPMNYARYMAGILVKSTLKLTRIYGKLNDLTRAFLEIEQLVFLLCYIA